MAIAVSLILGVVTRLGAALGALMAINSAPAFAKAQLGMQTALARLCGKLTLKYTRWTLVAAIAAVLVGIASIVVTVMLAGGGD